MLLYKQTMLTYNLLKRILTSVSVDSKLFVLKPIFAY